MPGDCTRTGPSTAAAVADVEVPAAVDLDVDTAVAVDTVLAASMAVEAVVVDFRPCQDV